MQKNILAIDIGINNLGCAVFKEGNLNKTYIFTETNNKKVEEKLYDIFFKLKDLDKKYFIKSDKKYLVYEKPYFSFNSDTGKLLDYVVGIIYLFSYIYNYDIQSFTATEVKKAVGIKKEKKKLTRVENKKLVQQSIEKILGYELKLETDHEIDAIAVGYTFLLKHKEENKCL